MKNPTRKITIERICSQRTGDEVIKRQIDFILGRALGSTRGTTWEYKVRRKKPTKGLTPRSAGAGPGHQSWSFEADITFEKTRGQRDDDLVERQWNEIATFLVRACGHSKFGAFPWTVTDGIEPEIVEEAETTEPMRAEIKDYATVAPLKKGREHFSHIYGRDYQIDLVLGAVERAIATDFQQRFHVVLHGPPACAKTEIASAVGNMLGEENEAYLKIDATTMTVAGIVNLLLDMQQIPPVIILEELEKVPEANVNFLLGALDGRGEIKKLNARIGHRARNVRFLCIATVNDYELFCKMNKTALESRFRVPVYCPPPSREIMAKILHREIEKYGGNPEWVEPTLKYCVDDNGIYDPRKVIPICMCGGDDLLDYTYQKKLEVIKAMEKAGKGDLSGESGKR